MSLDDRARVATEELMRTTRPDTSVMLETLKRRRLRGTAARFAGAAAVVALGLGGWAAIENEQALPPSPAKPTQVTNGALAGVAEANALVLDGRIEQLPTDVAAYSGLQFTADGSELVYIANDGQVVAKSVTGGEERLLAACPGDDISCSFALSPDERRLVLGASGELTILNLETGSTDSVRRTTGIVEAAWSPDGTQLAYVDEAGLHSVAADGSGDERIVAFTQPEPVRRGRPSWSPDGTRLSFLETEPLTLDAQVQEQSAHYPVIRFTLVVVHVATREKTELADAGACVCLGVSAPRQVWSPNGEWIAVSTVDSAKVMRDPGSVATGGIYLVRPDGSDRQLLTNQEVSDLAWQPLPEGSR